MSTVVSAHRRVSSCEGRGDKSGGWQRQAILASPKLERADGWQPGSGASPFEHKATTKKRTCAGCSPSTHTCYGASSARQGIDSPEAREGLRSILESQPDIEAVGVAASGKDGTAMVGSLHPDVVLVDAQMPGIDGAESTRRIKRLLPDAAVIVLAVHSAYIEEAIVSGADRALPKDSGRRVLLEAVRGVVAT